MPITVQQLASLVGGTVYGQGARAVHAARPLQEAGPDDVSFLETERFLRHIKDVRAGALVAAPAVVERLRAEGEADRFALIETADPLPAFIRIAEHLRPPLPAHPPGVSPQAAVDPTAQVGPDSSVLPFAVIGAGSVVGARCQIHPHAVVGRGCRLGDDVVLYPGAVLYDGTVLGNRVVVHAGAVLGSDGFGYRFVQGRHVKVPQLGHVEVGDDVEIGACTTVDRGTFQPTRIGAGTKIDNLVQIAHNCTIGRHNLLVSQVGIAGSCTTGDHVVMAGQVGVADHVHIGDGVLIGAGSGVPSDIPAGQRMLGYPVRPERETMRFWLTMTDLPALGRDVRRIKQHLGLGEPAEKKAG